MGVDQIWQSVILTVPNENRNNKKQLLKPSLHAYLDNRFTQEFKRLEGILLEKFEGNAEKVDVITDCIPEMDLKQWQKRVKMVPLQPTV